MNREAESTQSTEEKKATRDYKGIGAQQLKETHSSFSPLSTSPEKGPLRCYINETRMHKEQTGNRRRF